MSFKELLLVICITNGSKFNKYINKNMIGIKLLIVLMYNNYKEIEICKFQIIGTILI